METGAYTYQRALDALTGSGDPEIVRLSEDQIDEIAQRAAKLSQSQVADKHFRGVYRELAKDPAVRGVGVAPSHTVPPPIIIPRAQFELRAERSEELIAPGTKRVRPTKGVFTIIKPVLKEGGGKWRLSGPHGEFSAAIADQGFIDDVLGGKAPVPLAAEIHITADLETTEEATEEGAWKPIAHRVVKVYSIERQPSQARLFPSTEPK
jgi:hypothetical protein